MTRDTGTFTPTLFIIKPDAVRRRLAGEILAVIEANGFEVTTLKMVRVADRIEVLDHYKEHRGREYFKALVDSMVGHRIVVGTALFVPEPAETVGRFRELMGPYKDPRKGSIRGDYALSQMENSIHGSDSPESALRETLLWMGRDAVD